MANKWYDKEGLHFECQHCGGCCKGPGGYVWVDEEEIDALATCLQLATPDFYKRYVRIVFSQTALIDNYLGDCIFLEDNKCKVYLSRPKQCRTFPWWPELLESKQSWYHNNYDCPGMNMGKNYTAEEIDILKKKDK